MCKKLIYPVSFAVLLIAASSVQALIEITTAVGGGADTALSNDADKGPTVITGASGTVRLRDYPGTRVKIGLIRFDLTGIAGELTGATLSLNFTTAKAKTWNIYGLKDGANDLWPEATTNYNNAPGFIPNPPTTLGNWAFTDPPQTVLLGTFSTPAAAGYYTSSTTTLNMDTFLNSDTNKLVTLVIIGQGSGNTDDNYFTSKESTNPGPSFAPKLTFSFSQQKANASGPSPADKATDVPREVVLSWKPGQYVGALSPKHKIYFSDDFNNVNTSVGGVTQDPNYYPTVGALNLGFSKTYYWRVDEANSTTGWDRGNIWQFTVEPVSYQLPGSSIISATASSLYSTDRGPGKTIDSSGLNASDQHSTTDTYMWLSNTTPQPTWIQYEFDKVYKLYEMWVWNWNGAVSLSYGLRSVTIQYSTDGANWAQLTGVPEFAQATGLDTYVNNTTVNFQGVAAKYVKIIANSNWGGGTQYGLSEVRFFHILARPGEPSPASGATGVGLDNIVLSWRAGREAVSHKVYFSSNSSAVTSGAALVGTVSDNSYNLGPLQLGRTYYWKIDEVNTAATPPTWQGDVWSFATRGNFVVDDFESYTNFDPNIIRQTWIDGQGFSGHPGNGSGSKGYPDPNYAELVNFHWGKQALPVDYNNTKPPFYSEVNRTFAATQDWSAYGINLLSLWLRGYPASVGSFVQAPAGTYTMTASGTDIWNVADLRHPSLFHDEFHYGYTQISGDCLIIAKVESITNTNDYAKAGVMVRDSLDANSANVLMCITPSDSGGIRLQHRNIAGGNSITDANMANINAPYWVGIERRGDVFYGVYSPDGLYWNQLSSVTITMPDPVYIGVCLTAHNASAACMAVFTNVSINQLPPPQFANQDIGIKSNVAAPVYVTLQDSSARSATITHDDPNISLATTYQEWLITLKRFTSLNPNLDLTKLQKVTMGVGNSGTGTLYFDDIRLYGSRCLSDRPGPASDFTGDCFVDYNDLAILTNNWFISPSSLNSGLEAYYQFENNYLDSSGHNLNGDPCGNPTFQAGAVGNWAVFLYRADGNDCVNFKNLTSLDFGTDNWSVCAWIKTTQSGTTDAEKGVIFAKGGDSTGGIRYALGVGEVTSGRVTITTDDDAPVAPNKVQITSSMAVNNNVWHHVVGMRDGTTLHIYVDGLPDGTATLPVGYNLAGTSQHNAYVGAITNHTNGSLYKFFDGLIDEVRVYSRALSRAEIEYLAGKSKIDTNEDGTIDFKDYAILANMWLEELLWPPPVTNIWAYEFKNDSNCYDPGYPTEARDLHLEFDGAVYLIDTGPFTSFSGNKTNKITLSGGSVPANGRTIIRVGSTGSEKTLNKWWWTNEFHQKISEEMTGVGPSCKKIN